VTVATTCPFCLNDLVVNMTTSGERSVQENSCYHLFVNTGTNQYDAQTDSTGSLSINHEYAVDSNVRWTISGHL
jgi:hypothetical protein